jgi:ribosomal protein S27AE
MGPECDNNVSMVKRECIECGGELVMAFRPSENSRLSPGVGNTTRSNSNWRCSTCGHSFSAEQLRVDRRATSKVVEPA